MANYSRGVETAGAPGTRIRMLSPCEAQFVSGFGLFPGASLVVSGELDLGALDEAFIEFQRGHETLQAVVHKSGVGPEFVWAARPPVRIRVFEDEDLDARASGRGAVFDQAEQLVYLDVLLGEEHVRVTLFVHHAVADGAHVMALSEEFWSLYTHRVETGSFPPLHIQAFAQSPEHYLNHCQYPGAGVEVPEALAGPFGDEAVPSKENLVVLRGTLFDRIQLGKADAVALVRVGRVEGSSRSALISAALVRAHASAGTPVSLYFCPVDLRGHIDPPVGPTEATNMVGHSFLSIEQSDIDLFALARKMHARLIDDLADGTVYRNHIVSVRRPPPMGEAFGGVLQSTSNGRFPTPELPEGVSVVDFRASLATTRVMGVGTAADSGTALTVYAASLFRQRLNIEFIRGEPGRSAEFLAHVEAELRAAINAHAS